MRSLSHCDVGSGGEDTPLRVKGSTTRFLIPFFPFDNRLFLPTAAQREARKSQPIKSLCLDPLSAPSGWRAIRPSLTSSPRLRSLAPEFASIFHPSPAFPLPHSTPCCQSATRRWWCTTLQSVAVSRAVGARRATTGLGGWRMAPYP